MAEGCTSPSRLSSTRVTNSCTLPNAARIREVVTTGSVSGSSRISS